MQQENLPKLKKKMKDFVLHFYKSNNASEAYRYAYNTENMKSNTIWKEASRLLKHPHVAPWLEYLGKNVSEVVAEDLKYSVKQAINEADELLLMALENQGKNDEPNLQAALKAFELKNRLAGNFEADNKQGATNVNTMGTVLVDGNAISLNVGKSTEAEETEKQE